MDQLELIAKDHKYWCNIVSGFGCNKGMVEDVVQEMYIKMYNRFKNSDLDIRYGDNGINKLYVWFALDSVYKDYLRQKKKSIFVDIPDQETNDLILESLAEGSMEQHAERDLLFGELWKKIVKEMETWDDEGTFPYNKLIFLAYTTTNFSYTTLAKETQIPRNSIFNTVKQRREILAEKFGEDINKYFSKFNNID